VWAQMLLCCMTSSLKCVTLPDTIMTNTFDREALVEAYIDRLLDNMSTKDLLRIVGEQMEENLISYTDEELISEVESYYPDLLD
jgi:hypothetical protein